MAGPRGVGRQFSNTRTAAIITCKPVCVVSLGYGCRGAAGTPVMVKRYRYAIRAPYCGQSNFPAESRLCNALPSIEIMTAAANAGPSPGTQPIGERLAGGRRIGIGRRVAGAAENTGCRTGRRAACARRIAGRVSHVKSIRRTGVSIIGTIFSISIVANVYSAKYWIIVVPVRCDKGCRAGFVGAIGASVGRGGIGLLRTRGCPAGAYRTAGVSVVCGVVRAIGTCRTRISAFISAGGALVHGACGGAICFAIGIPAAVYNAAGDFGGGTAASAGRRKIGRALYIIRVAWPGAMGHFRPSGGTVCIETGKTPVDALVGRSGRCKSIARAPVVYRTSYASAAARWQILPGRAGDVVYTGLCIVSQIDLSDCVVAGY